MKKCVSLLVVAMFLICLVGCHAEDPAVESETPTTTSSVTEPVDSEENPADTEEESTPTKPKPQNELNHEELAKIVAKNLDVPEDFAYTYEISELFYWDAGEIWFRDVVIHTEDGAGARASVDPTNGDLLRGILNYEKPE